MKLFYKNTADSAERKRVHVDEARKNVKFSSLFLAKVIFCFDFDCVSNESMISVDDIYLPYLIVLLASD